LKFEWKYASSAADRPTKRREWQRTGTGTDCVEDEGDEGDEGDEDDEGEVGDEGDEGGEDLFSAIVENALS
jgi:hypothetical protein